MNSLTVLFGIALGLAVIDVSYAKPSADAEHHEHRQMHHRLKRQYPGFYSHGHWQNFPRPQWYEPRRDDSQQDLLPLIYKLLEDLTEYIKRPPQPQPIYIPYPVYPVRQYCRCVSPTNKNDSFVPNIDDRWPLMADPNQNWGYDDSQEPKEDNTVNKRPITLDSIPPLSGSKRPSTTQQGNNQSPKAETPKVMPRRCDAVVLACCQPQQSSQDLHRCFTTAGCADYFEKQDVCSKDHVLEVIDLFASTYAPKN